MVYVKNLFMVNVVVHVHIYMIGVKLNHVINIKLMVVVHMVINVILVMILKYANNSWEINVVKVIIVNSGMYIKVVLIMIWDSVSWVKHAKINILSGNYAGIIWMDIAKKEVNVQIIILKYLLKKISKNPNYYTSIFSSMNQLIIFVIIALKLGIKSLNVRKE